MLGWVEPALSKNWLCLLVLSADNLCKQFGSRLDPNKTSDLCFPLWCPFAYPFCASPITLFVYLYVYMTWNIYHNDAERGNLEFCLFQKLRYVWNNSKYRKMEYFRVAKFSPQKHEDKNSRFLIFAVFCTRENYNCKLNVLRNIWSMRLVGHFQWLKLDAFCISSWRWSWYKVVPSA